MDRLRKILTSTFVLVVFCGALWLLYNQLRRYEYHQLIHALRNIPTSKILLAGLLTVLNYVVLGVYDLLALRAIGRPLPLRQVALAACVGYAASFNFGALLGGSAVRYRLYSSWGLSTVDIVHLLAIIGVVFWIGMFGLAGTVFLVTPLEIPKEVHLPVQSTQALGAILLGIAVAYQGATIIRRRPIRWKDWELSLPRPGLSAMQLGVSALDLLVAAAVLYVLLPAGGMSYGRFVGVYLLAVTSVVLTHVPGGLGVFEVVIMSMLPADEYQPDQVFGSLLAFRFIYYLAPLGFASVLMGMFELAQGRAVWQRFTQAFGLISPAIVPRMASAITLLAGGLLLVANATPVTGDRLTTLQAWLPLWAIEGAHFVGGVSGVALLILGYALQRRITAAYWLAVALISTGILTCLARGLDVEEAAILMALLFALLPMRAHFYRHAGLLSEPPTLQWLAAVTGVVVAAIALGVFVHRRQPYEHGLWWHFSLRGEVSRFLRMTVGALSLIGLTALARARTPRRGIPAAPTTETVRAAARIAAAVPETIACAALVSDKRLLLSPSGDAMLTYGIAERCWIALADPVGPTEEQRELAWQFRELCDQNYVAAAFYQVSEQHRALYLDLGLTLLKLGDMARVSLHDFSLQGGARRDLRHADHRLQHEHCSFAVWHDEEIQQHAAELAQVEADYHREPRHRARWFSSPGEGRESAALPRAVVLRQGRIIAWGFVYQSGGREELAIDSVCLHRDAPPDTLDYLFTELLLWGHGEGFAWFNLGLAPHSSLEEQALAPLWERLGPAVFQHGEHFATFAALRQFKERFDPVWEPRYLASPAGGKLSLILQQIAQVLGERQVARPR